MRTLAIELNDAGVAIADAQSVLAIEPGYAVVEGTKIITGRDAVAKARLNPRQASNRFWNAMSLEPGSAGSEIAQSAAELAFAQIDSIWKRYGGGADARNAQGNSDSCTVYHTICIDDEFRSLNRADCTTAIDFWHP